ncbi:hypothetical protein JW964_06905 [candidate division KSB1 bacterium]|nr:hypothetical protein [candidate division KSB1 bacterium]
MTNHDEIIQKLCGNLEERVRSCRSKTVAEYLKRVLLMELKKHSADELTYDYFQKKFDELAKCYFDKDGCNKIIPK